MEGGARPDGVRSLRRTQEGREGARNAATQQSDGRVPTDPAGVYRRRVGDGVPPVQAGDIAGAGRAVGYVGRRPVPLACPYPVARHSGAEKLSEKGGGQHRE